MSTQWTNSRLPAAKSAIALPPVERHRPSGRPATAAERLSAGLLRLLLSDAVRERLLWRLSARDVCALAQTCKATRKLCAEYVRGLGSNVLPEQLSFYTRDLLCWQGLVYVPDTNILHHSIQPALREYMQVAACSYGRIYTRAYVCAAVRAWWTYANHLGRLGQRAGAPVFALSTYRSWQRGEKSRTLAALLPDSEVWRRLVLPDRGRSAVRPLEYARHADIVTAYTTYNIDYAQRPDAATALKHEVERRKTLIGSGQTVLPLCQADHDGAASACSVQ